MSKKKSGPKPAAKQSARERLRAERAKQQAAVQRREKMLKIGIAVGVAVVIVAIVGVVQWQRSQISASADGGSPYPKTVAAGYEAGKTRKAELAKAEKQLAEAEKSGDQGGVDEARKHLQTTRGLWRGVGQGQKDAPVVVEIFEDFSCPHCADFEQAGSVEALQPYLESGQARLVTYPMTMGSFASQGNQRAANAYACAADQSAEKAAKYQSVLFANQQPWDDQLLIDLGKQAGLESAGFEACVQSERFYTWEESIDQTATDRGVRATPTVIVDGKVIEGNSIGQMIESMKAEVSKAADGGSASDGTSEAGGEPDPAVEKSKAGP